MRSILARSIALTLALLALSACADPSAPVRNGGDEIAAPSLAAAAASGSDYIATGRVLHRSRWVNYDVTATAAITPERGGTLVIRSAGLKVTVPKYAVSAPVTIWVTAYAGNRVVYEFGPHGTQFLAPITIEQDLKDTKAYGNQALARDLFGGYAPEGTADIDADGNVNVSEVLNVDLVPDNNRNSRWARFYPTHFSGYILASGRTSYIR